VKKYILVFVVGLVAGVALQHGISQYRAKDPGPTVVRAQSPDAFNPVARPAISDTRGAFEEIGSSRHPVAAFLKLKSRYLTSGNARRLGELLVERDPVSGLREIAERKAELGDLYYIVQQEMLAQWFLRSPGSFSGNAALIQASVGGQSYQNGWMERAIEQDFSKFKANTHLLVDSQDRRVALDQISRILIAEDPQSAVAWAISLPVENQAFALRQIVLRGGAITPEHAASLAAQLPADNERGELVREIATAWGKKNADEALKWCETLPTQAEREAAFEPIFAVLAEKQPEAAASYALRLVGSETGYPYLRLSIQKLAETSLDKALEYTQALTKRGGSEDYVAIMLDAWADQDPIEALAVLSTDTDLSKTYLSNLVDRLSSDSPLEMATRLAELPEGELREAVLNRSASGLWRMDRNEAIKWLESPEAAPYRDDAVSAIVKAFSEESPEEMSRLAATISNPAKRNLSAQYAEGALKRFKADSTASFIR
jgi:uncharacterized protein (DUF2267 family)